jgi:hypothetical protein
MQAQNTAAGTIGLAERRDLQRRLTSRFSDAPVSRHAPRRRRWRGGDVEKPWRSGEDHGAPYPDQPDVSSRACRSVPDPDRVRHSWDATQPSIEPTSVTAGHTTKTALSHGVGKPCPMTGAYTRSRTSRPECASANGFANQTGRDGGDNVRHRRRLPRPSPSQRDAPERRRRGETRVVWLITRMSRVQIPPATKVRGRFRTRNRPLSYSLRTIGCPATTCRHR